MIENWIFEDNLLPFLDFLASLVGYDFTQEEWNAVRFGVAETDEEDGLWYDYEFSGGQRVVFRLARPTGSSVVIIKVESDSETESKAEIVVQIAQRYRLSDLR